MAMGSNVTGFSILAEVLSERGLEGLGSAVEILINEAMRIERNREAGEILVGRCFCFKINQQNLK